MRDFEEDDDQGTGFDRREFGKILVTGVGALSLATVAGAQESQPPAGAAATEKFEEEFDVIIVGAGLSGLIAARELKRSQQFDKMMILEANDHIGGRMIGEEVTVDGHTGYVDLGGQWVGPTQTAMLALLGQLKIEKFISYEKGQSIQSWDPHKSGEETKKTVFDGNVSELYMGECAPPHEFPTDPDGHTLPSCEPLRYPPCSKNADERRIWLKQLLERISVTVPCDEPWNTAHADVLDNKTFQQFLTENYAKDYTQWVPTGAAHIGGSGGFEPDEVSLLHMAWTQHVGPQSETPELWLMKGGAGQIPGILAEQLKAAGGRTKVSIGTTYAATRIAMTDSKDKVAIRVRNPGGETWTYGAKAVIVAIPPPLRQKIDFPDLSKNYVGFMYGSPMGSMSKVHAVYDHAFWRDQCLSGSAAGNLETCEFIADSSSEDGKPGILTSFIAADRNVGLRHATKEQVQELVLRDYAHFFGELALKPKKFFYRNWNNQQWTTGAFTSYTYPGVWTRYGEEGWRKPAGLIFWAGTETSERWPGYFDGAIRAGVRAANEVLTKLHHSLPPPLDPPFPAGPICPEGVIKVP